MTRHLACFGLLVGLLVPAVASSSPIGPITRIVVTENGIGPEGEACAAFIVTPDQVRAFLDKAVLISGSQQHDFFLHGPCSARGTLQTRYDTWHWEIRNMGTGNIIASNGDTFLLGDTGRNRLLRMANMSPDNSFKQKPLRGSA